MPYPYFRAGQRVTAALLNAGKPEITQTSGAQSNATTTVADVLGLGFWALKNKLYKCEVWVTYDAATGVDAKFQWWSNGGTMHRHVIAIAQSATRSDGSDVMMIREAAATPRPVGGVGGIPGDPVYHETSLLMSSGSDGWVTLQFAAQSAGTVTIRDGSFLIYTELS